jgi:fructoselysine-6-P-deglycase FrlB-like protein
MTSPETPDWYDGAVFPELRQAPPWVMEEMIAAESALPSQLADTTGEAAARLAARIREVVEAGDPLVVTGVGTSGHGARATALILNDAVSGSPVAAGPAEARESSDQELAPRARGLCLGISHGGMTRSTAAALAAAREAGASTALVTASTEGPVRRVADDILQTPLKDASYCHTVGYVSPILAAISVAAAYRGSPFTAAELTTYLQELDSIREVAAEVASGLHGARRLIAAGSLVDVPTARELALKVAEGARLPTNALGVEDTQHGHLAGHDRDSALVAIATGGAEARPSADRVAELLRSARHIGLRTAAIVSPSLADAIDPATASAGLVVLPGGAGAGLPDAWTSLLGGALALQHLTVGLVRAEGVNPDLIRREERLYREAVALSGAKLPRT